MKKQVIAALALAAVMAPAAAADRAGKYFAYFYNPGYNHYVMLSHAKCSGKEAAKRGWHQAALISSEAPELGSCWVEGKKENAGAVITVCLQNQEGNPTGGGCQYISKDRFLDAASLPRGAQF